MNRSNDDLWQTSGHTFDSECDELKGENYDTVADHEAACAVCVDVLLWEFALDGEA